MRIKILQNAKKLKEDPEFKTIYINRDLTFQQRKEARDRREEQRQQRHQTNSASDRNLSGGNRVPLGARNAGRVFNQRDNIPSTSQVQAASLATGRTTTRARVRAASASQASSIGEASGGTGF